MELKIKTKLILVGTFLAFVPTLIISIVLSINTINNATNALKVEAENKLTAIRSTTTNNIENYFSFIEKQIVTMSEDIMIIDTMNELVNAYKSYSDTVSDNNITQLKNNLEKYYVDQFDEKYKELNGNKSAAPKELINKLNTHTIKFQTAYISNNPNPLGEKDKLVRATHHHKYNDIHEHIHPSLRSYLKAFDYYDIFLVDVESGDIIYSVFKELDFATSLKNGPYANSGIGDAYRKALTATSTEQSFLIDFKPYLPSYNSPASFISSAIFDGDKMTGVLIFQMPINQINDVMTHGHDWKNVGLGNSGETYLVGEDFTMRSDGRFLVEDKTAYLSLMKQLNLPTATLKELYNKNTTIGLQPVKTNGVKAALKGKTGFDIFNDYRGVNVLSAYTRVKLGNLKWALMSEIDEEEAFITIKKLKQTIIKNTTIACSLALLFGAFLGWLFSRILLNPINEMQHTVYEIAQGENDLTKRLSTKGNNEVTQLSKGINTFIDKIDNTFADLLKSVARMVPMSKDLGDVNKELNNSSIEQKQIADKINECLTETNHSTTIVNKNLEEIKLSSANGKNIVNESEVSIKETNILMNTLSKDMEDAVQAIDRLQHDTNNITSIIDVINSIADQTNLLALNAAIEAARAGEAGRGFAVVADEVRSLASKTSESTHKVAAMVNAIQSGTESVVKFIRHGQSSVIDTNQKVGTASEQLKDISGAMSDILNKVHDINEAINSQKSQFEQVNEQYNIMNLSFEKSVDSSAAASKVGQDLDKLGAKLLKMIEVFKVTDDAWSTNRRSLKRD